MKPPSLRPVTCAAYRHSWNRRRAPGLSRWRRRRGVAAKLDLRIVLPDDNKVVVELIIDRAAVAVAMSAKLVPRTLRPLTITGPPTTLSPPDPRITMNDLQVNEGPIGDAEIGEDGGHVAVGDALHRREGLNRGRAPMRNYRAGREGRWNLGTRSADADPRCCPLDDRRSRRRCRRRLYQLFVHGIDAGTSTARRGEIGIGRPPVNIRVAGAARFFVVDDRNHATWLLDEKRRRQFVRGPEPIHSGNPRR